MKKSIYFNGENLFFYRSYHWLIDENEKQNRVKLEKDLLKNLELYNSGNEKAKIIQSQLLLEIAINYEKMGDFAKAAEFYYYCLCIDNKINKFNNLAIKKYIANRHSLLTQIQNILNLKKDYSLFLFFKNIENPDFTLQNLYSTDKERYFYTSLLLERFIVLYPNDIKFSQAMASLCYCYYKTDRLRIALTLIRIIQKKYSSGLMFNFSRLEKIYQHILSGNPEPAYLVDTALAINK